MCICSLILLNLLGIRARTPGRFPGLARLGLARGCHNLRDQYDIYIYIYMYTHIIIYV